MKRFSAIITVLAAGMVLAAGFSGCNSSKKEATVPAPQAQPAAAPGAPDNSLSGKVVETMNSGGYTYVLIDQDGKKTWVAGPHTAVKVGQKVTCEPGMVMTDFTSKTLNRTFKAIVFSGGIR